LAHLNGLFGTQIDWCSLSVSPISINGIFITIIIIRYNAYVFTQQVTPREHLFILIHFLLQWLRSAAKYSTTI
jgi:hypothetical protein